MRSRSDNAGARRRRLPGREATIRHSAGPPCPHYPRCIGCPYIDLPYPEQLARKRESVVACLAGYASLAGLEVPPVIAAPHRLGYRARVKLVVRSSGGEVATGLYVPGTHRVMDISSCAVHPKRVNQVLRYLKKKCIELNVAPYDERVDSGDLRYLDFRYSFTRSEVSVTLVTRHREFAQAGALARALARKFPWVTGIVQNINEERGNVIWGQNFRTLVGRDGLLEKIGPLMMVYPAGVFSQGNPAAANKVYDCVVQMAAVDRRDVVLDLYCGVGPISLFLAPHAGLVWGIDDSSLSINAAKQNARRNGIGNCRFVHGEVADKVAETMNALERIDCVVVNPTRKGVQAATLTALVERRVPRIVYVSCEPASLARDLDFLMQRNYRLSRLQPFDMFPQTDQVETVALLER